MVKFNFRKCLVIFVLFLGSASFSGLFYFDLLPFTKKEIKDEKTAAGFIKEFGREIVPLTAMHLAPM